MKLLDLSKEKERYREFCREHIDKVYTNNTADWLDKACIKGDWGAKFAEKDGSILGVWPYYITRHHGMVCLSMPTLTQFLGPILIYPENMDMMKKLSFEKEVLNALFDQLSDMKIDYISQNLVPELTNWLPLYWKKCEQTTRYTYIKHGVLNITEEELLKTYSKTARRNILKFLKGGYTYINAEQIGFSALDFYNLHCECLKKIGKTISFELDLLVGLVEEMVNSNRGELIAICTPEQQVCAATFIIFSPFGASGINTAADHTINGIGYLCKHAQIYFGSRRADRVNLGGSMIESIESVYSRFGAEQTPYFSIRKDFSERFKIMKGLLTCYRAFKN